MTGTPPWVTAVSRSGGVDEQRLWWNAEVWAYDFLGFPNQWSLVSGPNWSWVDATDTEWTNAWIDYRSGQGFSNRFQDYDAARTEAFVWVNTIYWPQPDGSYDSRAEWGTDANGTQVVCS
jgi:hypothetical protein